MIFSKIASHKSSVSLRACPSFHQVAEFISLLLKCRLAVLWLALTNRLHQKSHCPLDPALVRLTNCHFHFLGTLRYPVTKSDQSAWDKGHMQSSSIRCEIYTERDRETWREREEREGHEGRGEEEKRERKKGQAAFGHVSHLGQGSGHLSKTILHPSDPNWSGESTSRAGEGSTSQPAPAQSAEPGAVTGCYYLSHKVLVWFVTQE